MPVANRPIKTCLGILILVACIVPASAQKNELKGIVLDTAEKKVLQYSFVALIDKGDSLLYRSIRTNGEGAFLFTKIPAGKYTLMIGYPKMADHLQDVTVTDTSHIDLGKIAMITEAKLLEEVVVTAGVSIRMRGDTLEYNADSFAVKPGSNVEALLKRLPGIQVGKDGKIYAQGQEVQKVLVDGDEFFSDDPGLALKYLQAGAVDKVQVFDQKSDQTLFTGIDDGSRSKTINLKLKKDKKNGYFGKISTGHDGKDLYNHEAMGAIFNGTQKMSVFGMSAKNGKAGLSSNELSSYVAQDYEVINDGIGGTIMRANAEYESDSYYGSGIPSVKYGGGHFSDKWHNDRQKLFANYRIKEIDVSGWSNASGSYLMPDGTGFFNKQDGRESSYSLTQRASGSFSISLDSFTTFKIAANGNLNKAEGANWSGSESRNEKGFRVNNNEQSNKSLSDTKRFGSDITWQQKFRKKKETTFSLTFQQEYSNKLSDVYAFSASDVYDPASGNFMNTDTLDQLQQTRNPYESYAVRGMYTDKFNKNWGMILEYGWKTARVANVFNTYDGRNGKYDARIDSLSNDYSFNVNTHITGAMLTWSRQKFNISAGGKAFHTGMEQVNNDLKQGRKRRFLNLAPQLNAAIRVLKNININVNYTGQTMQPSIEQLQPLRRTSNRLYVQEGNPDLRPAFWHSVGLSVNKYDPVRSSYLYGSLNAGYTDNAIILERNVDAQNKTIARFINLDGVMSVGSMVNYNWQYKKLNLRPSVSVNANKGGSYSMINGVRIRNENFNSGARLSLSHDWKEIMTTSWTGSFNYSVGWSNAPNNQTNRNFYHSHTLSNDISLPLELELESEWNFQLQPKNSAFSKSVNIIQWNLGLERTFLDHDDIAVKLSVNDLLNQNTGYSRYVSGNSIHESNRLVLKRNWLLTVSWNFSKKL